MFIDSVRLKDSQASGYDSDAQTFIDAVGTLTTAEEVAINDLVIGLKANGTWAGYHAIYPFIGGTAAEHKWNLKNPVDTDAGFRIDWVGTLTHDANGVTGDGSSGYGTTNYVWNTEADFDDMSMSMYVNSNNVPTKTDAIEMAVFHHSPNTGFILGSRRTSVNASVNLMAGNTRYYPLVSSNDASGYHVLTKGTTGTALYYSNGVEQDSQAVTNQAMTGATGNEIFLFTSSNGANTPYSGGYSNQRMAFSAIGLHLTPAQITADKATIEAYQTALSRL